MSKISSIFVLLCVIVIVVRCQSPDSMFGEDYVSGVHVIVKAAGEMFKTVGEFFADIGKTVRKAFENLTNDVALAFVLRCHVLVAAAGVADEERIPFVIHEKYYAMATSTAKLCGKLYAMEKCFDVLMNGSLETADFARNSGPQTEPSKILKYYTKAIETKIQKDSELSDVYRQIKRNLPVIKYMNLNDARANLTALREMGKQTIKFMLYKMHVQHSYVNIFTTVKKEYYVTARSVFELAKKPSKSEALQMVYDEAISEVIDSWDKDDFKVILDTPAVLYAKLEEKISSSPELKDDYEEIKQMVEHSSKWTIGLFNVNLLPL